MNDEQATTNHGAGCSPQKRATIAAYRRLVLVLPLCCLSLATSCSDVAGPSEVTAVQLDAAYRDDPAAADQTYRGRTIIVSGEVAEVSVFIKGEKQRDYRVELKVDSKGNEARILHCNWPAGRYTGAEARRGAKVRIQGIVRGKMPESDVVVLDDCSLVE
jgi:hypothetical protein